jgi:hypothetical protein
MAVGFSNLVATLGNVDPLPIPPGRTRWLGKRRVVLLAVVLLVGVGAAVALLDGQGRAVHENDSGPLQTGSETITSLPVEVGQVFTFGGIVLKNTSEQPAILEDIRIEPPLDPGMTLVDLRVAGADRRVGYVGSAVEFPPTRIPVDAVRPWRGAVVPGRADDPEWRGLEIIMGLRVNHPGEFGFRHVVVDYRIGGKQHRVRLSDSFIACAPARDYPPGCHLDTFFEKN